MKHFFLLPLLVLLAGQAVAQGPTLDPGFLQGQVYAPGLVRQAVQQPDGKRVLVGNFTRAGGSAASGLARLLAGTGQSDATFQSNVAGLQGEVNQVLPLPNGQLLLLGGAAPLVLSGVARQSLLLLNSDGTPDAGFDTGSGITLLGTPVAGLGVSMLAQPDGKIVLTGAFTAINGQPVGSLARLNGNGTLDATFQAMGALNNAGYCLALQPDGKLLVGGAFTSVQGQARARLARLLPTGALDTSFAPVVPTGVDVNRLALQPSGSVVVVASRYTASWRPLMRVLPTGAIDATFQTGTGFVSPAGQALELGPMAVQADGKIVLAVLATSYNGTAVGRLVRLLPDGPLDPSFANQTAVVDGLHPLLSVQALPNGQLLTAGAPWHYGTLNSAPIPLSLLNADGTRDVAFTITAQQPGIVSDVLRQPDGKLVLGGDFTEINGLTAGFIARLNADGTPDATFTAAAAANDAVHTVALQPDGKVLVGGRFTYIAGAVRLALARLLITGAVDGSFAPTTRPLTPLDADIRQIAVQPDGNVLLRGDFNLRGTGGGIQHLARVLGSTGLRDAGFQPADSAGTNALLVQPNGRITAAGAATFNGMAVVVWQMLPTGALDPAFALTAASNPSGLSVSGNALTRDAMGRLYVARYFDALGSASTYDMVRLSASGVPDTGFQGSFPRRVYSVTCLAVQPNNRLLAGGSFQGLSDYEGTVRLLPTGGVDASYNNASAFGDGVQQLLIQPDGALVAAGGFRNVGSLQILGLARMLDANVLAVPLARSSPGMMAWPVPTQSVLHLTLETPRHPLRVQLLDVLGRVVLTKPVFSSSDELNIGGLPTGVYLLRVDYAMGHPTSQRIVRE